MQRRKCQSTLEYALIIAVVVSALLMMQHYLKRGVAGKLRSSTDDIGEQYDPTRHTGSYTQISQSKVQSENNTAGVGPGIQRQTYGNLADYGGSGRVQVKNVGVDTVGAYDPAADRLFYP